ncbi:unnamed protein product [Rhizoctonia solani]|uniref:DUF6535 domain-containing protein n=1 Tax=Rhizoctonia solani TaxID=456999 RepID=A0A8H2XG57_9AGAM|nr:unnamed protein product [Rhizoctonia solani]
MAETNVSPEATRIAQEFDEYSAEFEKGARVWKAYMKEADKFDVEQVDEWNRSLDMTLIFVSGIAKEEKPQVYATTYAALFTAICTAFLVESSKSLKIDPIETSARRLDQITNILLVIANISSPQELNSTQILSPEPFSPRVMDLYINMLWSFSLITSASVSLIAILAKEWCYLLLSGRIGDPWSQTKRRQKRWEAVQKLRIEQLIVYLPIFLHASFLSFAFGLCVYFGDLNPAIALLTWIFTGLVTLFYMIRVFPPFLHKTHIEFLRLFGWNHRNSDDDNEPSDSISIKALAWLISTSEDPKSTDIALQAIAGADPDDAGRQLLKESEADKMILRRLIDLEPGSRNYDTLLGLYTRALAVFQPSPADTAPKNEPCTSSREKAIPFPNVEVQNESTGGPRKSLNRELPKKLRDLRDTIGKEITAYATSNATFQPSADNIQALRIGSTAASYCLQSLQNSTQALEEQFDSAVELLASYRNRKAQCGREIQYLVTGIAMLLSSLLVDCPPDMGAQYVMRLLRIAGSAGDGQKPLLLKYLGVPMAVYALSRYDYPGWTQPPPLSSISRAERAIEMIADSVLNLSQSSEATPMMINLGLLELLSSPGEYKLDDDDIKAIAQAFDPVADDAGQAQLYTLPPASQIDIYSRPLKTISTGILNGPHKPLGDTVSITYLTVLNRTRMDDLVAAIPLGQVYAFVTECVLNLSSSDPLARGQNVALDLMQKFHNYHGWTQDQNLDLARSLTERETLIKLMEASEAEDVDSDRIFVTKLFATGQAWFFLNLAMTSETADQEDWSRCLDLFIEGENSPEVTMQRLGERRNALAEQCRSMWENRGPGRDGHNYLRVLYDSLPPAGLAKAVPC